MVVYTSSLRSLVVLELKNVLKGRAFCTSARSTTVDKPDVNYHYDIKEVKHHETMAKEWWDPAGGMKALHAMNDLRIPFIKNGLVNSHRLKALEVKNKVKFLEGVKILDVGCGGGILSEALARLGGSVTGIDPSDSLVGVARSHSKSLQNAEPPTYVVSTVEQHAHQAMATYDVVVASEVIEHVTDKESFLAACIASLKLGGSLFITTPNRTIASWLGGIIMAENLLNMVPKGTHSYSKFIKPSELSVLCEKYGCSIQLINGMFYDPVRNKWMWSPTKTFIYSLHAIKIKDLFR
ncbi:ubiquinone biosynthesis O-methyltransferase, mitochondrial-like isoform X1 [Macrosteles quadrilineatus]|uniref:ubiquinone biosynthesis O-methyltransferase, mitochondrial-like isoform X1 n=2 Tax=Macrosteles quadrilineatus TaxID=74068 RepID=UPI0023E2E626|nr:ubiquinone biosynthesis O-methyltransferase, mitochondrial-like isoform X1 [Macrosteles quadrilineatus]